MLHINTIEIEDIADLLDCTITAANTIVGNKQLWNVPPCGHRKSGSNQKRQWEKVLATREAERINKLRDQKANWKKEATNHSYSMENMPVTQFPQNKQIREYFRC